MHHKTYQGVYDRRLVGIYGGRFVYYDKEDGYVIERRYWKKPTKSEVKEIKEQFGDLEKKLGDTNSKEKQQLEI